MEHRRMNALSCRDACASPGLSRRGKVDRPDVTTDGLVGLSNGTLQPKRTLLRASGLSPAVRS
ncbi:MAG TPA: hypothetical protein VK390_12340, partial [Propionibacteriaceae bacterium]|nr:hypothetical protein [Propionibacteriaceae bacterium]